MKKLIAGNWKMNKNFTDGLALFSEVINMANDELHNNQQVVVCCPYLHLHSLVQLNKGNIKVAVGAQNCHQEESGAFTGEISADMLASAGVQYVIIGHSERRQYFGENNVLLAKKIDIALKHNLIPIYCIGETLQERESGEHFDIIKQQILLHFLFAF